MEQTPLKTHWYTDRGRRPSNEDAVIVEALFGDRDLVAVADGMGGHAGGEVASGKALETLLSCLESSNDLAEAIRQANDALQRASEANPEWRGMGTTLVALLRVGDRYYVANVGDSRAYRIDHEGIGRITEDHSFTAEAVSSGRLSEDEAERSPWRNALTRAVGTDAEVEVDVFGPFELEPPHVVVLCTDGLYRVMSDEELGSEVLGGRERVDGARDLVANALRRGSSDNISVALVEFGDLTALESVEIRSAEGAAPLPAHTQPVPAAGTQEAGEDVEVVAAAAEAAEPSSESSEGQGVAGVSEDEPVLEAVARGATPVEAVPVQDAPSPPRPGERAPIEESPVSASAIPAEPAAVPEEPPIETAQVTSSYRKAQPARPRRHRGRSPPRQPRKLPSWVKREALPAVILVLGTLAIVYVLTSVFS